MGEKIMNKELEEMTLAERYEIAKSVNKKEFADQNPFFVLQEIYRSGKLFKAGDPWDWLCGLPPEGLTAPLEDRDLYVWQNSIHGTKGTRILVKKSD
jgi:hypothetical protein